MKSSEMKKQSKNKQILITKESVEKLKSNSSTKFLPFEEAREYVRSLGIKNWTEWQEYCRSGNKPDNIPSHPSQSYKDKGWVDLHDFVGKEKTEFLPFEEAREYVRSLRIKNSTEWNEYSKSGQRPDNIPSSPSQIYKDKGWVDLYDFLGKEKTEFLPFEEAREYVRSLGIKNSTEWQEYCKSGNKPDNIPSSPHKTYKDKGWVDLHDFLGNEKGFLPFEEAREYVRSLGIKNSTEWQEYCKSGNKPDNIPSSPYKTYKDKGWVDLYDFLGKQKFLPFEEAREYVRSLRIKNSTEWNEYYTSGNKPDDIPSAPDVSYKDKGWIDWYDFLGKEKNEFLPFQEAREFVRSKEFETIKEWKEYCKSGNKPDNIPSVPDRCYKDKGWVDWYDFLGKEKIEFLNFEEAREFARSLGFKNSTEWQEYCKSGNKPDNIPSRPSESYKDKGWVDWYDFLGNGKAKFLPFEEAREYVRSLGIKNSTEWEEYCKSGNKPDNIPSNICRYYEEFKSYSHFFGTIGSDSKNWLKTKKNIVIFFEEYKEYLHTCNAAELITILEFNGLGNLFTIDILKKIQESNPDSAKRKESVESLINEIKGLDEDQIIELSDVDSTISDETFSDIVNSELKDNIEDLSIQDATELQIKQLKTLDNDFLNLPSDVKKVEFIIEQRINNLWYDILNGVLDIEQLKNEKFKNDIPKTIHKTFLKEYKEVNSLKLPKGWTYQHEPLLMQKLIAYRLKQRKRYGNWSGVGSGKTISAILAGRYVGAKNTLVITFNSTIGNEDERGWTKEIRDSFKDSKIYTKSDRNIVFDDKHYNYLVLNYETFQQKDSAKFVIDLIKRNKFDYIVLDEVQSVKQRDESQSKRREIILGLIDLVKKSNPDYYLLAMSATPVINNLFEAKSLIELIEEDGFEDIDIRENISNCINVYRRLTNCGIRYKNIGDNILKDNKHTLVYVEANHLYSEAMALSNSDFLNKDRLLVETKLEAISPYINTSLGKTIIYISYVDGIEDYIYNYLTDKGFKTAVFTGSSSKLNREDALNDFISGDCDVILASRPIAWGVDGLQKVSDRIIIMSLPYTNADLEQLIGRISRKGSNFKDQGIDVIIPLVSISNGIDAFRWDHRRYNSTTYKKTIANAAVDGIIPDKIISSMKEVNVKNADNKIDEIISELKSEPKKKNKK